MAKLLRYLLRVGLPPDGTRLVGFTAKGANPANAVITFKTDFRPSGFDRPVTEHFKDQIVSRLIQAGIVTLTVTIKRDSRHELVLHLEGGEDDLTKAEEVLKPNRLETSPIPNAT